MELFDKLLSKIVNKEPFSFSRWGDGEWNSVLQIDGENYKNTDGHTYFKDMGEALSNVLKSKPAYYLGMQRFAREERYPNEIDQFIEQIDGHELNWVNADVFHHASIKGYFDKFFDVLVKRDDPVILVGPEYLSGLGKFYNYHIVIPEKNCWLVCDKILEDIHKIIVPNSIILFVSGMPANWMIDRLHNDCWENGVPVTLLDMGSVLDPYCGKVTRSYHKKIIERIKAND